MKKQTFIIALSISMLTTVIVFDEIFKAGMGVGIFIVVLVMVLIIFLISRMRKKPVWESEISFGLVNIFLKLTKKNTKNNLEPDIFDNQARGKVRFQRVNVKTDYGVKWNNAAEAHRSDGNYIML